MEESKAFNVQVTTKKLYNRQNFFSESQSN